MPPPLRGGGIIINARATDNAEDEQPQPNQQAPVGSATGTDSDCVPDNDNSTQTEAIAGPPGHAPEPNQSAESAIAVVMTGDSTPAEETPEEYYIQPKV